MCRIGLLVTAINIKSHSFLPTQKKILDPINPIIIWIHPLQIINMVT